MSTSTAHSADLFVPTRDFWWNRDFLELMARRWELASVHAVLDVGCGVGHWGRTLLPHLPEDATIVGVDPEPKWVRGAGEQAERANLSTRLRYTDGRADALPFDDDSFDLVTCQTVLVHVPDVLASLREMIRVLKPGGLLAVAEPNNLALSLLLGQARFEEDPEVTLALVRLQLICERGKRALGEGYNSVGDLIPGYFGACGLRDIAVYQSDHATPLIPPYETPAQRANRDELVTLAERGSYIWERDEAERYFRAGGGRDTAFAPLWKAALDASRVVATGLHGGTEHQAGGSVFYLVSARKPS